jgi:hypothetical protein
MWLLATFQLHFIFLRVEVSQDLVFNFQSNEGATTLTSVVVEIYFDSNEKNQLLDLVFVVCCLLFLKI